MTAWRSVSIGLFLVLSCAVFALFFGRPSAGQAPAPRVPPAAAVARYQLAVEKGVVYLCDTHTGQLWYQLPPLTGHGKWTEIKAPASKEKK
jgi:hypothetical protein